MPDAPAPEPATRSPGLRLLVLLPVGIFVALAILFAARLRSTADPSRLPSVLIGRPAPSLDLPSVPELRDAAGRPVPGLARSDLAGGTVTVVNVWASWCAPCRLEHPLLVDLAKEPGIRLVGINYKDKPEAARRFLSGLGNPFAAVGADETGRAGIEWGVYGVPETFVIGPGGIVRYKQVGPLSPESLPAFRQHLREAAAAARP